MKVYVVLEDQEEGKVTTGVAGSAAGVLSILNDRLDEIYNYGGPGDESTPVVTIEMVQDKLNRLKGNVQGDSVEMEVDIHEFTIVQFNIVE